MFEIVENMDKMSLDLTNAGHYDELEPLFDKDVSYRDLQRLKNRAGIIDSLLNVIQKTISETESNSTAMSSQLSGCRVIGVRI